MIPISELPEPAYLQERRARARAYARAYRERNRESIKLRRCGVAPGDRG